MSRSASTPRTGSRAGRDESANCAPDAHAAPGPAAQHTAPDAAWISQAVADFERPLTQYVTRLLRGDMERARDVVQDAFVKLWTQERTAIDGHLGQWLYRVCRNRALDVRRKEHRMTALSDEHLEAAGASAAILRRPRDEEPPAHEDARVPHDTAGAVALALLETLNETQQEVLRLKFQGGLSYKEIAVVMDITANHVGVLIHHAIKTLRERLPAPGSSDTDAHRLPG